MLHLRPKKVKHTEMRHLVTITIIDPNALSIPFVDLLCNSEFENLLAQKCLVHYIHICLHKCAYTHELIQRIYIYRGSPLASTICIYPHSSLLFTRECSQDLWGLLGNSLAEGSLWARARVNRAANRLLSERKSNKNNERLICNSRRSA